MRTTEIVFFVMLLASSSAVATQGTTLPGCVQLSQGNCTSCYRRKLLQNRQGCGPVIPATDYCVLYSAMTHSREQVCSVCAPGFALKTKFTNSGGIISAKCVRGSIQNCLLQIDFKDKQMCYACGKGTYSVFDKTRQTSTCRRIGNPTPHCLWGSVVNPYNPINGATCSRCDPGFAVDLSTGRCQRATQAGCWTQSGGKCLECNPFDGYSVTTDGGCAKTPSPSEGE